MSKLFFLLIIVCVLLFLIVKGNIDNKNSIEKMKQDFLERFGSANTRVWKNDELNRISYYAKRRGTERSIDELTWNDLDMDLIYQQIAYTQSSIGDDYLYYMLKNPVEKQEILEEREKKIDCISNNPKIRIKLQILLARLGRIKNYSFAQYLDYLMKEKSRSNGKHYVLNLLILISVLLMIYNVGLGLVVFFFLILYNIVTYFKDKAYLDPYLTSIRYLFKILESGREIVAVLPQEWKQEKEEIGKILDSMKPVCKHSFFVMSPGRMAGEGFELVLDYLRMIFHLDIIKFNQMMCHLQKNENNIWDLYEIIGKLDACIAVGQYRTFLSTKCVPDFIREKEIKMVEGYHPLVENPVSNSVTMKKNILLTGSNASGKSTFLKTMGVNVLLAQTIHTCLAKEFSVPFCRLFTSMSLKDSISLKESYYMAEIKAIKRVLDAEAKEDMIICMVDEVLRGTNTIERIAASTQILKGMSGNKIMCIAATHDVELTKTLENEYDNYHFEESMEKGDIQFSYKLRQGRANSSNAIDLLANLGYDDKIIEKAREMVKRFEQQGEWICE